MCPKDGSVRELVRQGEEACAIRRGQLEVLHQLDDVLNGYKKSDRCGSWSFRLIHIETDQSFQVVMAEAIDSLQDPGPSEHYFGGKFEKEVFFVLKGDIIVEGKLYRVGEVCEVVPGLNRAPIPSSRAKVIILRGPR